MPYDDSYDTFNITIRCPICKELTPATLERYGPVVLCACCNDTFEIIHPLPRAGEPFTVARIATAVELVALLLNKPQS